jgi:hypothetical protein
MKKSKIRMDTKEMGDVFGLNRRLPDGTIAKTSRTVVESSICSIQADKEII